MKNTFVWVKMNPPKIPNVANLVELRSPGNSKIHNLVEYCYLLKNDYRKSGGIHMVEQRRRTGGYDYMAGVSEKAG